MVRKPQPPNSTCADVSSSHPFFISACHLVGRSLCASAVCYACFACALTARGLAQAPQGAEDDASGDGYDAGAKVSVAELLAKQGKLTEAMREFQVVAEAYERGGFYPKAAAIYKQMLRFEPDQMNLGAVKPSSG